DTEHFIQSVFPNLRQLKREYRHTRADRVVWKIVHAALDAHTAGFYLTGALAAVCLLDFLRGDWARRQRQAELLREATLRRHRKRIENDFRAVLEREFPHLGEQKVNLMLRHVEGLRWWPTRASYRDFLA